jgi:hypothetical protein
MTKNERSWLTRLEEADRKTQRRLELENNHDTKAVFKETDVRSRKPTAEEQMRISTLRISGFFVVQLLLLGWLAYASSGALEGWDALTTTYALVVILSILSIAMIMVCIYTLSKQPKAYSLYFILLFSCLLTFSLLSKLG